MGLKEEVTKRYNECEQDIKKLISSSGKVFTTWSTYQKKVKNLKDSMCLFSEKFDEWFKDAKYEKIIKLPRDITDYIDKNFVKKIVEMKKSFIYVFTKDEKFEDVKKRYKKSPYSLIIEKFEDFYERLDYNFSNLEDITDSKDLAKLFAKAESDFSSSYIGYDTRYIFYWYVGMPNILDNLCVNINRKVLYFIKKILSCAKKELTGKNWIIGEDKKYFYEFNKPHLEYMHKLRITSPKPVFRGGKPSPDDVKQNETGDCYLMAPLISLAKTNPEAIKACFVQGLDKIETEDDIDIRFFRRVKSGDAYKKIPVIITVNKITVIGENGIRNGVLWPKLIEKAFAIFRKKGFDYVCPEQKNLEGGRPETVMFAITGREVRFRPIEREYRSTESEDEDRKKSKFNPENVISTIAKKIEKGMGVTCGFNSTFRIFDAINGEMIEIHSSHAYAVDNVNEEKECIEIINPLKISGEGRSVSSYGKTTDGLIAMSFSDFKNHCEQVTYTTHKDSPLV